MGTRGGETQDTERQSLTLLPPPGRRVPRLATSNGEGGWVLWRPPGRRPFREPWRIRGHGRQWRSRELGRPWRSSLQGRGPSPRLGLYGRSPTTPQKTFLGGSRGLIRLAFNNNNSPKRSNFLIIFSWDVPVTTQHGVHQQMSLTDTSIKKYIFYILKTF